MKRYILLAWYLVCITLAVCVFGPIALATTVLHAAWCSATQTLRDGALMWQTAWTIFKKGNAE